MCPAEKLLQEISSTELLLIMRSWWKQLLEGDAWAGWAVGALVLHPSIMNPMGLLPFMGVPPSTCSPAFTKHSIIYFSSSLSITSSHLSISLHSLINSPDLSIDMATNHFIFFFSSLSLSLASLPANQRENKKGKQGDVIVKSDLLLSPSSLVYLLLWNPKRE